MSEPDLDAIKEHLATVQRRIASVLAGEHEGNPAFLSGRWVAEDCRPVLAAVPALLERIASLERELADCARDCRKAGARFEQALALLVELDGQQKLVPPDLWLRLHDFLELE